MRSNPSAAWDKVPRNQYNLGTDIALRRAPSTAAIGKAAAKHDKRSLNKGRSWRMKGTFVVPANRTKLSPITWA